jgi:hypothetical protein
MEKYERIIGKEIVSFNLKSDGSILKFLFKNGESISFIPEGDCCSTSWIESIDNDEVLKGKILSIEDIPMPNLGNIDGKRYKGVGQVEYYGLKIRTENGDCVIDYRNDSNGYYGGWINLVYSDQRGA